MTLTATVRTLAARLRAHRADTSRQRGFTLIELSIVLVIIGLLIGGIVKGQELIENARGNKVQQELQTIGTAVMNYRTRFGTSPIGDDRFGVADEDAWLNMRAAGLLDLAATDADNTAPRNALGAAPGFTLTDAADDTTAGWDSGLVVCALGVPPAQAIAIASAMDPNGDYEEGDRVRLGTDADDGDPPAAAAAFDMEEENWAVCVRATRR